MPGLVEAAAGVYVMKVASCGDPDRPRPAECLAPGTPPPAWSARTTGRPGPLQPDRRLGVQQVRNLAWKLHDAELGARCLLRDRDSKFNAEFARGDR
jgi:hypothetical protein